MSNLKSIFAVLVLTAIVGVTPLAHAQHVELMFAGSSAMWQSMALAAYNSGNCIAGSGVVPPCSHYTGSSNFNVTDTRPGAGHFVTDAAAIWIIWDSAASPNVWAYIKTDSVVGTRCYFAQPHCIVGISTFPAVGNKITLPGTIWGGSTADVLPPSSVQALFTGAGVGVNAAATDIRPEDGLFATCRANSALGGGSDDVAGLGYGVNSSGACPTTLDNTHLVGSDITSRGGAAHVLAFNISGKDPFTRTSLPAGIQSVSVGAAPIVFVAERDHELAGVKDASDDQLQTLFSGANCDASVLGFSAAGINIYLREPLSGTMNTTEATVFRYPFNTDTGGKSQETGVGGNTHNPLTKLPCGSGFRTRAVGTGEEVADVLNSHATDGNDGIGYAFFSYGNISSIAHNNNYGYLTLNGVDPIWHAYGTTIDPGQPTNPGNLPSALDLPASCGGAFPCSEGAIWSSKPAGKGLSFPNVRNGSYRAWSLLRIVSDGAALVQVKTLVSKSNSFNVSTVPDYVPFKKTVVGSEIDPGLGLLRSHYQEKGGGVNIGPAPINVAVTGDKGGDMGGCILTGSGLASTSDTTTGLGQAEPANHCVVVP
jgi:hypothetical protein